MLSLSLSESATYHAKTRDLRPALGKITFLVAPATPASHRQSKGSTRFDVWFMWIWVDLLVYNSLALSLPIFLDPSTRALQVYPEHGDSKQLLKTLQDHFTML